MMNDKYIYVFDYENCQISEIDCLKENITDIDLELSHILDENGINEVNCYYMCSPNKLEIIPI